jgi:hypothetical protein
VEQVLPRGESWHSGRGKVVGKWGRRVNTVQKLCTHSCKCNNDTCCDYYINGGGGIKGSGRGGEFKHDIVDTY